MKQNKEKDYFNYKFSIIISIFNSDLYLKKSIDSIINQTLDFEENIQLILVDDGSIDTSKKIVDKYHAKYPNNIIVLSKDNGGPGSARNLGLKYATGEYINFLDSDDYLSDNTLEEVYRFFKKNENRINVVSIPMKFFERMNGDHDLNYKFSFEKIVNLKFLKNYPQISVSSSFFNSEAIKNMEFNEDLIAFEDALFINKILIKDEQYGILNSPIYYYRKRHSFNGIKDNIKYDKTFYNETIFNFYNELIDYSYSINKEIPKFIQYSIIYTLQEIFKINFSKLLSNEETNEFFYKLINLLNLIDEDVILENNNIDECLQNFLIYLKENSYIITQSNKIEFLTTDFNKEDLEYNIFINKTSISNDILYISGNINSHFTNEKEKIYVIKENEEGKIEKFLCDYKNDSNKNDEMNKLLFTPWQYNKDFEINIPCDEKDFSLFFEIEVENNNNIILTNTKIIEQNKEKIDQNKNIDNLNDGIVSGNYLINLNNNKLNISKLFNFSIVMAMYNVEDYLAEAIDSLINQTIDFEENVQLILVDDGSPDNSKDIALEYHEKYPNNILVISKENGGHPSALNEGLKYIKGKFINFLDSDDCLEEHTLEEVLKFYENHYDEVDLVAVPLIYFERITGPHRFNYRFKTTRVIDLIKEPENPQYSVSNAFIKRNLFNNLRFNTKLHNGYDAAVANKIIINKKKYGVLSNGAYYYRQRANQTSIMDNNIKNKRVFTEKIKYYYIDLINYCLIKEGKVPYYVMYALSNDLQGLLAEPELDVFDNEMEIKEFWYYLDKIVNILDLKSFVNNRHILKSHLKPFFTFLKNNKEYSFEIKDSNKNKNMVYLKSKDYIIDRLDNHGLWLDIIEIRNGLLNISGIFSSNFSNESLQINIIQNHDGEKIIHECDFIQYAHPNHSNIRYLGIDWLYRYTFDISIPIEEILNDELQFEIKFYEDGYNSSFEPLIGLSTRCGLSDQSPYLIKENQILHISENRFKISKYSYSKMLRLERHVLKKIRHNKENGYKNALIIRTLYTLLFPLMKNKRIWLFSDRPNFADDNGTYLFEYASKQKDDIKKYFVIDKNSKDYNKMKKISKNILNYGSLKHKILYLFSEKTISAFANEDYYDPFFGDNIKLYEGFINRQKYFLQHGVTIGNYANALNKARQNFSLILTSAYLEYESFFNEKYNYDENRIQLLGLPRHDHLKKEVTKKQIIFMPTWRISLNNDENSFKNSEYYKVLHSFLNNERLHKILEEKGYELVFRPHPELFKFIDLMEIDKKVRVSVDVNKETYHDLFNESALMITDYSSVFFDFAYLKKPIIYYQFDEYHYDKGYFDFETMGFGEIVSEEEKLINKIKEYLDNNCKMEEKYIERVKKFFKYNDKNNSKRVYDWIKLN